MQTAMPMIIQVQSQFDWVSWAPDAADAAGSDAMSATAPGPVCQAAPYGVVAGERVAARGPVRTSGA